METTDFSQVSLESMLNSPRVDHFTAIHKHKQDCVRIYGTSEVALKIVDKKADLEEVHIKNIEQEYLILSRLNHPSIVGPVSRVETEEYIGFLMPLLSERTEKEDPIFIKDQVVSAVRYMYSQGVVHLDLTYPNIMMRGSTPVIIDFQVAQFRNQSVPFEQSVDVVGESTVQSCCGPFEQKNLRRLGWA